MARPKSELGDIRTSARSVRLLRFLKRKPVPAKLLGETEDGEEVTCVISATGPAQWTDALSVVRHCVEIKALDSKDQVLRKIELDPDDPELRAEGEVDKAMALAKHGLGGSVPIISVDIPKLVDNLARNMREVAGESARQQSNAFKEGFAAMISVVNFSLGLLVRMENRLAATEDELADRAAAGGNGEPTDPRAKMAMAALERAMGAGANGSGGMDPAKMMQLAELWKKLNSEGGGEQSEDPS